MLYIGVLDTLKEYSPAKYIDIDTNIVGLITNISGRSFNLINFVFFLAGLFFLANLILAAWDYLTSTGDTKKVAAATQRLLNAFFGIAIVLASFIIVRIVVSVLGFSDVPFR